MNWLRGDGQISLAQAEALARAVCAFELSVSNMRLAAERCLRNPLADEDARIARDILDCIAFFPDAKNITASDRWFNGIDVVLPGFMEKYSADGPVG